MSKLTSYKSKFKGGNTDLTDLFVITDEQMNR